MPPLQKLLEGENLFCSFSVGEGLAPPVFIFLRLFDLSYVDVALFSLPQRGRGTALAVDEEKVSVKLAIIKIRNDHNTSSVRRDIIYPAPKPSAHVCHLSRLRTRSRHGSDITP